MSDEDFALWLAKERARHAEGSHKDIAEAVNRTKTRASSLLGWCITLSTATIAAATQSSTYKLEAVISAIGFGASALACVRTLYATEYQPIALSPRMFDTMVTKDHCDSEEETYEAFSRYASDVVEHNASHAENDQKWLRRAWWLAAMTPVATAASFLLVRAARCLGSA